MKVLVTGASGFVGHHLCHKLHQLGIKPEILVRDKSDCSSLDSIELTKHIGDITKLDTLEAFFKAYDCVFHLAGLMSVKRSDRDNLFKVNVDGTHNIIQCCEKFKVKKLIHLSSAITLGGCFNAIKRSEDSLYNLAPYKFANSDSKLAGEKLVQSAINNNLNAYILKPSLIYGARDALKPIRIGNIKMAQGKIKLYPKGGANIVHINYLIQAMINCFQNDYEQKKFLITGENLTLKEMLSIIAQSNSHTIPKWPLSTTLLKFLGIIGDLLKLENLSREMTYIPTMYFWYQNNLSHETLKLEDMDHKLGLKDSVNWMKENQLIS